MKKNETSELTSEFVLSKIIDLLGVTSKQIAETANVSISSVGRSKKSFNNRKFETKEKITLALFDIAGYSLTKKNN